MDEPETVISNSKEVVLKNEKGKSNLDDKKTKGKINERKSQLMQDTKRIWEKERIFGNKRKITILC